MSYLVKRDPPDRQPRRWIVLNDDHELGGGPYFVKGFETEAEARQYADDRNSGKRTGW